MSRGLVSVCAGVAVLLALAGTACEGERRVVRVGVLIDCTGLLAQTRDMTLAAAALPLIERGGELSGGELLGGARGGRVGEAELELVPDCTELTYGHLLIAAARRLIEEREVDVVVGPIGGPEGVVTREIAAHYPDVTVLAGASLAQEVTLRDPQPNLFRFTPDGPQLVAGLGAYAYGDLGWRRAVVVAEPYNEGWELAAGFVAEFCALGGTVVERDWGALVAADPTAAATRHSAADGVALFANFYPVTPYLGAYAKAVRPLDRRLVVAGASFADPANLAPGGVDLTGVVLGGYTPLDPSVPSMKAYRGSFAAAFPEFPRGVAEGPGVLPFYTAVEAVARALEETGGELGEDQHVFRNALAGLVLDAPQGAVLVDRNRQATGHAYLERITRGVDGTPSVESVRTLDGIEQSFGGIFSATTRSPSTVDPPCERRGPPPWAD